MRVSRVFALPLLAVVLCASPAADFTKWWPGFQAAVAKGDAKAVAERAYFPLSWELGPIREIKSETEFLRDFDKYFTAEVKKGLASGKRDQLPDGTYMITWKARGNEYSMYFRPTAAGFVLDALSEGPA